MNKDRKYANLKQEALKKHPFTVPEGYFESFGNRLSERIRQEELARIPVRRIGSGTRFRVAMAAALVGLALISYSVYRFTVTGKNANGLFPEVALLEKMELFDDDYYLYELMEEPETVMNEDEAFAVQAIDYLAMNEAELVLIFE